MSEIIKGMILGLYLLFFIPLFAHAVTLTPSTADISLEQGQTGIVNFAVLNTDLETKTYKLELLGVKIGEKEGAYTFHEVPEGLVVDLDTNSFDISSQHGKEVRFSLSASEDLPSQTIILGLHVQEVPKPEEGVTVSTGIMGLVFITIGNDIEEKSSIRDFSTSKMIYSSLPTQFFLTIRNDGERILQPEGNIVVKNIFGKDVALFDFNPLSKRIPENQERTFVVEWGQENLQKGFFQKVIQETSSFHLGVYKAHLDAKTWSDGEPLIATKIFVLFPWRTIVSFSGILLVLVGVIYFTRKR